MQDEYVIRRKAAEFGIPIVTNLELAQALVKSLVAHDKMAVQRPTRHYQETINAEASPSIAPGDSNGASGRKEKERPVTVQAEA